MSILRKLSMWQACRPWHEQEISLIQMWVEVMGGGKVPSPLLAASSWYLHIWAVKTCNEQACLYNSTSTPLMGEQCGYTHSAAIFI